MMSKKRRFGAILRRNDGSTVIEFAFVAPALLLLLIGMIDVGLVMFTTSVLEAATSVGARIGKTGYTESGLTPEQFIHQRVIALSGGFLDPNNLTIDRPQAYNSFNNIGNGDPCTNNQDPCSYTNGTGSGGQVVLYRVTYQWNLLSPTMAGLLNLVGFGNSSPSQAQQDYNFSISAISVVKNEPFP